MYSFDRMKTNKIELDKRNFINTRFFDEIIFETSESIWIEISIFSGFCFVKKETSENVCTFFVVFWIISLSDKIKFTFENLCRKVNKV